MNNNERTPSTLNRRELLAGLASGLLVGGVSLEANAADAEIVDIEAYEVVLSEIEGQIKDFAEQKTNISKREILHELRKCTFIEGSLRLVNIDTNSIIDDLQAINANQDSIAASHEALRVSLDANHIQLPQKKLVVAQVDFKAIAMKAEAFYDTEFQTIFVDQQPEHRKADGMSRSVYTGVMTSELNSRKNSVIDAMAGQDRESILAKLVEVEDQFAVEYPLKDNGKVHDVPPELLLRYQNNIRAVIARTRAEAAMKFVKNKNDLTHEAFHHFFETMFGEAEYEGPNQEAALVLALKGIRDRGAISQASKYAPEFFKSGMLERYHVELTSDASIAEFAKTTSERFDFSHYPANAVDTPDARDLIAVYRLVNEFLARIYSGALGHTDAQFETAALEETKDIPYIQMDFSKRVQDLQCHTPNEDELDFLHTMKWQGNSVV